MPFLPFIISNIFYFAYILLYYIYVCITNTNVMYSVYVVNVNSNNALNRYYEKYSAIPSLDPLYPKYIFNSSIYILLHEFLGSDNII